MALPSATPPPLLPDGWPPSPPVVTGATVLPRFSGGGVIGIGSEQFSLTPPPYQEWADLSIIDIAATSDVPIFFDKRQDGCLRFNLIQWSTGGWRSHPQKLILDNLETQTALGTTYTTRVRLRVEALYAQNQLFAVDFMSYDTEKEREVSWEIYIWE
jgi:hypothetical protein